MNKEVDVKKIEEEQKNACESQKICSVGGQALMEGIMMLGPHGMCQVVRDPQGNMVIETKPIEMLTRKHKLLGLPVIRGVVSLIDSLRRGMKALFDSAEIAMTEEEKAEEAASQSKLEKWIERKLGDKAMDFFMGISLVLAVCLSLGLFVFLPLLVSGLVLPEHTADIYKNLVEGLTRMVIFFGYMVAITVMKDIRRVYMYHGAEHKTISCYEKGLPLTVENVRSCSKHHPRCGTAFLFVVVFISILITSIVPRFGETEIANTFLRFLANLGVRFVLLPFVAGIAYEFNRLVGKYDNWFTRILRAPGMGMQRFTTMEPDDSMIEVAIVALGKALSFEGVEVDVSAYEPKADETTADAAIETEEAEEA